MKSFIFIKLILLSSFFFNVEAQQKTNLIEKEAKSENPYLSKSKELKQISF